MTKEEEKYTTLDTEQCKWWLNTLFNMAKEKACNSHNFDDGEEIQSAQDKIISSLNKLEQIENIVDAYTTDDHREPMYDTEDYMNSIKEVLNG